MAQADARTTTSPFRVDSYSALSDEALNRLHEVREALSAIADLTDAGTGGNDPQPKREELASLFRVLAHHADTAIATATSLPH